MCIEESLYVVYLVVLYIMVKMVVLKNICLLCNGEERAPAQCVAIMLDAIGDALDIENLGTTAFDLC